MAHLLGELGGRGELDAPLFCQLRAATLRGGWACLWVQGRGPWEWTCDFSFSPSPLSLLCFPRIEEELGSKAKFAGRNFRNPLAK